jgi:hemin uptake protein HemP
MKTDELIFSLDFKFNNTHFKGNTEVNINNNNVIISSQDPTGYPHKLIIDHDDFRKVIEFYEKTSNFINDTPY